MDEKNILNANFIQWLQPNSVLDVYSGGNKQYVNYNAITNDKNEQFDTDYHLDALKLLCKCYYENKKFDYIDLDPFGSAYECFDLAFKMCNKGMSITFGELGHKRFKRLDYVSRYYGINNINDFTIDNLILEVERIAAKNKKQINIIYKREWKNIGRIWFEIEPIKITKQWEKKENDK